MSSNDSNDHTWKTEWKIYEIWVNCIIFRFETALSTGLEGVQGFNGKHGQFIQGEFSLQKIPRRPCVTCVSPS